MKRRLTIEIEVGAATPERCGECAFRAYGYLLAPQADTRIGEASCVCPAWEPAPAIAGGVRHAMCLAAEATTREAREYERGRRVGRADVGKYTNVGTYATAIDRIERALGIADTPPLDGTARAVRDRGEDRDDAPRAPAHDGSGVATVRGRVTKCRCAECGAVSVAPLEAPDPFVGGEVIYGCPECRGHRLESACDESGCARTVSCGTPTPTGYRHTCGRHRPEMQR